MSCPFLSYPPSQQLPPGPPPEGLCAFPGWDSCSSASRDGTWPEFSADLIHAGRSCAPRTESVPQGEAEMKPCIYLGLESNKTEAQLVRGTMF